MCVTERSSARVQRADSGRASGGACGRRGRGRGGGGARGAAGGRRAVGGGAGGDDPGAGGHLRAGLPAHVRRRRAAPAAGALPTPGQGRVFQAGCYRPVVNLNIHDSCESFTLHTRRMYALRWWRAPAAQTLRWRPFPRWLAGGLGSAPSSAKARCALHARCVVSLGGGKRCQHQAEAASAGRGEACSQ